MCNHVLSKYPELEEVTSGDKKHFLELSLDCNYVTLFQAASVGFRPVDGDLNTGFRNLPVIVGQPAIFFPHTFRCCAGSYSVGAKA